MNSILFKDLNLSAEMQRALDDMGFEEPTPIQAQTIPHILDGKDVIGQAQTGTGKTCAFGIPSVEMIDPDNADIQVLILSPTRELAIQISEELKSISKYKQGIRSLPIYGGQSIERQISALKKRPQIIIGTPGRVMDHMRRRTLKLGSLKMVILDEADEMLNMGFREDIDTILERVPENRQTVFFSATMPKEIIDLTSKYQKDPVSIKVVHKQLTVPSIEQYYLELSESSKAETLSRLIDANDFHLSLVFCNTKKRVDELTQQMQSRGYSAEALHGDLKQDQRNKVMDRFRKGNIEILVATDVAARGIDVDNIEAVFNYDIPNDTEYYVHRIGRTGRAGKAGKSFTFAVGRDIYRLRDIQRHTKSAMILIKPPTISDLEERRIENILDSLTEKLKQNSFSKYIGYIENTLTKLNSDSENEMNYTSMDLAASMLQMLTDQNKGNKELTHNLSADFDDSLDGDSDMVRLFINVGRKNRVQPRNIVQSIASSSGIPGKLIGSIDIFDDYTFVEVPRESALTVMNSMKNYNLMGKKVSVERSKKPASDNRSRRSANRRRKTQPNKRR
jgi:ATP-dependent RNA helicase DeaD